MFRGASYNAHPSFLAHRNYCFHTLRKKNAGDDLSSRAAARQVFSAQLSLTTVFGMGTGGTSMLYTPTVERLTPHRRMKYTTAECKLQVFFSVFSNYFPNAGKSKNRCFSATVFRVGDDLFSRAAARRVSSARMSLTTVFGMGTGGTSS